MFFCSSLPSVTNPDFPSKLQPPCTCLRNTTAHECPLQSVDAGPSLPHSLILLLTHIHTCCPSRHSLPSNIDVTSHTLSQLSSTLTLQQQNDNSTYLPLIRRYLRRQQSSGMPSSTTCHFRHEQGKTQYNTAHLKSTMLHHQQPH